MEVSSDNIILFLDDQPERAARACGRMRPEDQAKTIWCKTAQEAIDTIRDYYDRIEKMSLDHDLGGPDVEMSPRSPNSGMEVVRYIEKHDTMIKTMVENGCSVVIHSWNGYCAGVMQERLQRLGFKVIRQPFGM